MYRYLAKSRTSLVVLKAHQRVALNNTILHRVCCVNDSFWRESEHRKINGKIQIEQAIVESGERSYQKKIIYFLKSHKKPSRFNQDGFLHSLYDIVVVITVFKVKNLEKKMVLG
jgi:hypothetical protein